METNPMLWGFSFVWGVVLGLFYFGGLWITLKYISRAHKQKSWLAISFVIRMSFIMIGFWAIIKRDPVSFIFTFLAFLITRAILTHKASRGKIHAHQS